ELARDGADFRLWPAESVAAGGLPVGSSAAGSVDVSYEVRRRGRVGASAGIRVGFGPSDGLITEPLAPVAPPVASEGDDVTVQYDLSTLRYLDAPSLFVSGIGHWSPVAAPLFHLDTEIPLSGRRGRVHIPASAFRGGAGLYGIGIRPQTGYSDVGQIAVIRIAAGSPARPDAPLVADARGRFGHIGAVSRAAPRFSLRWNASGVGDGAALEV